MPGPNDHLDQSELLDAVDALLEEADAVSSSLKATGRVEDPNAPVTGDGAAQTPKSNKDTTDEPDPSADAGAEALGAVDRLEASIDELLESSDEDEEPSDETGSPENAEDEPTDPVTDANADEHAERPEPETETQAESESDPGTEPEAAADDTGDAEVTQEGGAEPDSETETANTPEPGSEHNAPESGASDSDEESGEDEDSEPLSAEALENSMDILDAALDDVDGLAQDPEDASGENTTAEQDANAERSEEPQAGEYSDGDAPPAEPDDDNSDALLDAALDDLMGEDTSSEAQDATPVETPKAEPAAARAEESQEPAPASFVPKPEPVAVEPAPDPKDSTGIKVPEWFERAVERVRPRLDKIDPKDGKCVDAAAMALGWTLGVLTLYVPIGATRFSVIVSKPLVKQSHETRNAVGWIALWTAFLSVVVWGYIIFVHTPPVPTPTQAPSRVMDSSEPSTNDEALP